jgi:hypothetical protein
MHWLGGDLDTYFIASEAVLESTRQCSIRRDLDDARAERLEHAARAALAPEDSTTEPAGWLRRWLRSIRSKR